MKNKKIVSILSLLLISGILIGCSKGNKDVNAPKDTSIEDIFEDQDKSETDTIIDEATEDIVTDSNQNLSYDAKTITYKGGQAEIPIDWKEYDINSEMKIYLFSNLEANANILSDSTMGLSPEEYMLAGKNSVLQNLNVKDGIIDSGSKVVNGVTVYYFEYTQDTEQGLVYTYQPTIFINDKVHILTIASSNKDVMDNNKNLADEISTTIRE